MHTHNSQNRLFAALLLVLLALLVGVVVAFSEFTAHYEQKASNNLQAVALAQRSRIEAFLKERRADAEVVALRAAGSLAFVSPRKRDRGPRANEPLAGFIGQVAKAYGYSNIVVMDRNLHPLAACHETPVDAAVLDAIRQVRVTGRPVLVDVFRAADGKQYFGVASPIAGAGGVAPAVAGIVYLQMDADALYGLTSTWPEPMTSAETLFVEQRRGHVVYLSPLRFARSAPAVGRWLTARLDAGNPAAGPVSGTDYRGVDVLGVLVPIGGTRWFLLVKMDRAEVVRPVMLLRDLVFGGVGLVLLLLVLLVYLAWRRQQAESMAADARKDARYNAARKASIDAYVVYDAAGRIIEVNDAMTRMTGYLREELLGRMLTLLHVGWNDEQVRQSIARIREAQGDRQRSQWRRKNGELLEVEISSSYLADAATETFHSFVHDIGPQLQAQQRIERLNMLYRFLNHANTAIFSQHTPEAILTTFCEGAVRDGGFILAWAGLLDEAAGLVRPVAASGVAVDYIRQLVITTNPALATSHGPTRMCMVQKQIISSDDFQHDPATAPWYEIAQAHGIHASAAVPVLVDGKAVAALTFYSDRKGYFSEDIRLLLEEAVRNVSLAFQAAESERRKEHAEAERQVSENLFRRAFDASPVPMFIESISNRTLRYVNPALTRSLGYELADVPDETAWFRQVYPDAAMRQTLWQQWNQNDLPEAAAGGAGHVVQSPEVLLHCRDGSSRTFRGIMTAIGDDAIVQWLDLTEIKHAEAELVENERRFRGMIEQSLIGIYVTQDSRIVYVNPRLCEILGWKCEDLLGRDSLEFFGDDAQARRMVLDARARLLAGEHSQSFTLPFHARDNTVVDLAIHASLGVWNGRTAISVFAQDITERKRAEAKIAAYVSQLEQSMEKTLHAVATMVEMRDPYTAGHEQRVGLIAAAIAREMGWPEDRCHHLELVGLVHDIGKIAVPVEILSKPTRLTPLEFEMVKIHAEKGYEILMDIKFDLPVAEIIREHHERIDGSGYPHGLKGEQILPEARILAVADVLESMASHRPYRPALGIDAAVQEIISHRGIWFDADVVDAMLRLVEKKGHALPV